MLRMAVVPIDVLVGVRRDVDLLSEQESLAADLERDNPYFNVMGQATPQKLCQLWIATYSSLVCSIAHTAEDHTPPPPDAREPEPPSSRNNRDVGLDAYCPRFLFWILVGARLVRHLHRCR
jgi:hypothetical protein